MLVGVNMAFAVVDLLVRALVCLVLLDRQFVPWCPDGCPFFFINKVLFGSRYISFFFYLYMFDPCSEYRESSQPPQLGL